MKTPLSRKSTLNEIRERFDVDVDRFSDLETGQAATMDAKLSMALITSAAAQVTSPIRQILDVGCGAGNNTIQLLRKTKATCACDLCDLSPAMLERARQRVSRETSGEIRLFEGDFLTMDFQPGQYDVILAAAVLHHLREESDWQQAFSLFHRLLRPGGSLWITDLIAHDHPAIDAIMNEQYGRYLTALGGEPYCREVFAYIDKEDSPRSLTFQLRMLQACGFDHVEVLHKNACFAAFGAIKA